MTKDEFYEWCDDAVKAYSSVHKLFQADDDHGTKRSEHWFAVLRDCDVGDARDAITAMLRGEIEAPQYGFDDFPTRVRAFCRRRVDERLRASAPKPWEPAKDFDREAQCPVLENETALAASYTAERMQETGLSAGSCLSEIWPKGEPHPKFPEGWKPKSPVRMLKSANP